jgi:SAM-dependent methyltransferase
MASIEQNRTNWDDPSSWERDGDNWSDTWGSTRMLWFGTVLPRIASWLPAGRLLEIACGHGRITEFLLDDCEHYTGIDLAPSCIEHCRQRFAGRSSAEFHETDGKTIPGVEDESVDFALSWDSLVHADIEAMTGYVEQLARKLRPGGAAFLHHSNLAEFCDESGKPTVDNPHWRDATTSARAVRELCSANGLLCRSQELVQWNTTVHTDSFTVLSRPETGATSECETTVVAHPDMGAEIAHFRTLDRLYRVER